MKIAKTAGIGWHLDGKSGTLEATLRTLVERNLSQCMHANAAFLCERLHAQSATAENAHLLALCYYRGGRANSASAVLRESIRSTENAQNTYLFAVCCYELGDMREAEDALLLATPQVRPEGPAPFAQAWCELGGCPVPGGAAGLHVLGLICKKDNRRGHAVDYFILSLRLDCFFWASYEELCSLGENIAAGNFFGGEVLGCRTPLSSSVGHRGEIPYAGDSGALGSVSRIACHQDNSPVRHRWNAGIADLAVTQGTPAGSLASLGRLAKIPRCAPSEGSTARPIRPPVGCLPPPPYRWSTPNTPNPGLSRSPASSKAVQCGHKRGDKDGVRNSSGSMLGKGSGEHRTPYSTGDDDATCPAKSPARRGSCTSARTDDLCPNRRDRHALMSTEEVSGRLFCDTPLARGDTSRFRDSQGGAGFGASQGASRVVLHGALPNYDEAIVSGVSTFPEPASAGLSMGGAANCLALLRCLGNSLRLLSQYRCAEAVELLEGCNGGPVGNFDSAAGGGLSRIQFNTGWVLRQCAVCYYEMSEYSHAKTYFEAMRRIEPYRVDGLEVYSTVLWHLKVCWRDLFALICFRVAPSSRYLIYMMCGFDFLQCEVELCYLAQQAVSLDTLSPQVWCVVGNCFSLQKEHETALRFFQRALRVDPSFTYAHTLSGHEFVSNEDFDKAVSCYRRAVQVDPRHYNAWYGLGTIYFRQEKYDLAEYHFKRALAINPRSSVLHCYLGMVLKEGRKFDEALEMLQRASVLQSSNPQAQFQRANVLVALRRHRDAIQELEAVRDFAPREASVHYLMGKVCKLLGEKSRAMRFFNTALDLDPTKNAKHALFEAE